MGIPIVEQKTKWGTTLVFLGIELDSIKMEACLPDEKLKKCLGLLKRHGQSKKITVKQLESLTGLFHMLSDSSWRTIPKQNVFSDGKDEEAPIVFHTEANQRGAAGHVNMGDISTRF